MKRKCKIWIESLWLFIDNYKKGINCLLWSKNKCEFIYCVIYRLICKNFV